ncbi:MAG: chemotaxis response regulator protein-glutamate methylesterase [Pseudomonadota bacterium]
MEAIKVLIVDDSAVVRKVLTGLLNEAPGIEVTHAVADPLLAMERMRLHWPDVIVLDIEMPRMDGITFLKKIMSEHPTPVVICSSVTEKSTHLSMEALAAGAVAVINRPRQDVKDFATTNNEELVAAVMAAAGARVRRTARERAPPQPLIVREKHNADVILAANASVRPAGRTEPVVAIGTSTGGTQALEEVLTALPRHAPGMVIVQHMPEKFTAAFAQRLDAICAINVREAVDKDRVLPGVALIAPGGKHMLLRRTGASYHVEVVDGPLVNRHRPSVDVLFRSVATYAGANALGIIMTGMGDDGAAGLLEMRETGALTVAQDEKSCVVYGMPMEAVKRGAVMRSVALGAIEREIMQLLQERARP